MPPCHFKFHIHIPHSHWGLHHHILWPTWSAAACRTMRLRANKHCAKERSMGLGVWTGSIYICVCCLTISRHMYIYISIYLSIYIYIYIVYIYIPIWTQVTESPLFLQCHELNISPIQFNLCRPPARVIAVDCHMNNAFLILVLFGHHGW